MKGACGTGAEYGSSWGTLGTDGAELTVASPATAAPLDGRTVVITGASDGIGAAAAQRVAGLGARVVVVGRSAQKTAFVLSQFGRDTWYLSRLNGRWWNRYAARSPEQGAAPLAALAVRPDPQAVNGTYLHRFKRREWLVASQAGDARLARQLWERSAELTGLPG
jgi:short subunit dehydrogenase